jgi:hypothetical protein
MEKGNMQPTPNSVERVKGEKLTKTSFPFAKEYIEIFDVKPVHFITFGSLPLIFGAYAGYRKEIIQINRKNYSPGSTSSGGGLINRVLKKEITATKVTSEVTPEAMAMKLKSVNVNPGRLAFTALGIGSLLSIGGVGLITAAVFKASGSDNLDEFLKKLKEWTPRKRKELEDYFGIQPKSMQHEDVKATKHMTEEEEWEYIKMKYIPELLDTSDSSDKK